MVILRERVPFFSLLLILLVLILIFFLKYLGQHSYKSLVGDIKQSLMVHDHGFSTPRNLLADNSDILKVPLVFPKNIIKSLGLQIKGFPERPTIERIEINIKFKEYRKILDDRNRFLKAGISSNQRTVKADIKYRDKVYKSKIRLKGDYSDHWDSSSRMSFRIDLKQGTIFGFKRFSIQKNESRAFPYDQVFGELNRNLGNLSPKQTFAHIFVNGQDWGLMNVEEHISKEFLEKQSKKESLVFKFGNDTDSRYSKNNPDEYRHHRIGDDKLNLSIYQQNKYLKDDYNRLLLSYISSERLATDSSKLFNIKKYAESFALASAWGDWHALGTMNSRNYFNPYLLVLEPITTDNGPVKELPTSGEKLADIHKRAFDPYGEIIASDFYRRVIGQTFSSVKRSSLQAQKHIDHYQSYFPGDRRIDISTLHKNIQVIEEDLSSYLLSDKTQKQPANITMPTREHAADFPVHIHARHYTNGKIEIYNLLPDIVTIKSIRHEDQVLQQNLKLDGFKAGEYLPITVETNIAESADKKIIVETEYKGNIRKHLINYSLIPGPYHNPLENSSFKQENFLTKLPNNKWQIKNGEWKVTRPITLTGSLSIEAGTTIHFSEGSYIIVKGQLIANGSSDKPITLSSNKTWKGIYVIGDGEHYSNLNYVRIKNTRALTDGLLKLTGGVNFYNSRVEIQNTQIRNTKAEDALNIIDSDFVLENVKIENTFSDAFDSDFSRGIIKNSSFFGIGGDAVDFSGSEVRIVNSSFSDIRDKAVSVGEASLVNMENITIQNVGVGIASKDGSKVIADNVKVKNYKLHAAMAYIKKDFYTQPSFIGSRFKIDPIKKDAFITQKKALMSVNSKLINAETIDVKRLYQNEVMKK